MWNQTPSFWGKIWNEQDVRVMVLISLALQLFLLFAGNVPRRRRVGWLRFLVWLAYLAAYAVAASAIGLFSQYEGKYKLRSLESSQDLHTVTMPFLWAPFLLLHLGGPDTITAFSIEDNDLWTRQLLNLAFQLSLALYVFWKSFDLLDSQLLAVAAPLFVAGIIKYVERIRALRRGSRDDLDFHAQKQRVNHHRKRVIHFDPYFVESRALESALSRRGLLVGRTVGQLGPCVYGASEAFTHSGKTEVNLEFVMMGLSMIYDMLYTKAMVLQSWIGSVFRCIALVAIMVAFVLFWVNEHLYAHRTTNAAITYTLFVTAIFMEVYSIFMAIASPWTRARFKVLHCLSSKLACCFPSQGLPSLPSMGQFNLVDYSLSTKSRPKFISKVSEALGLEKHWRNFWYVKHVEDKEIMGLLFTTELENFGQRSQHLELGMNLKNLLALPFEDALFRLHVSTEMYLSKLVGGDSEDKEKISRERFFGRLDGGGGGGGEDDEITLLVAQCRKLSNYLMYLMTVYPSMLPVGSATRDLAWVFAGWVRGNHDNKKKAEILHKYVKEELEYATQSYFISPLEFDAPKESLKELKEVWVRLLMHAAGKCRMELVARQLSNGVELLSVAGSLMIHNGLGDAAERELNLLELSTTTETEKVVAAWEPNNDIRPEQVHQQQTQHPPEQAEVVEDTEEPFPRIHRRPINLKDAEESHSLKNDNASEKYVSPPSRDHDNDEAGDEKSPEDGVADDVIKVEIEMIEAGAETKYKEKSDESAANMESTATEAPIRQEAPLSGADELPAEQHDDAAVSKATEQQNDVIVSETTESSATPPAVTSSIATEYLLGTDVAPEIEQAGGDHTAGVVRPSQGQNPRASSI